MKLGFVICLLPVVAGCMDTSKHIPAPEVTQHEVDQFIKGIQARQVYVQGGEFLMGDFGIEHGPEGLPYDLNMDSRPLHKVRLTSYSIDKFKIRNEDYQFYLKANGLKLREDVVLKKKYADFSTPPNNPAPLDWFEADKYCTWLADITGLEISLPTEAQWEYAARSRGQFLKVATDDGEYRSTKVPVSEHNGPRGINISTPWDRRDFADEMGWNTDSITLLPVDRFPPNPLGLYSMSDNGAEWVKDWYDPDYYKYSPVDDPQGPDSPVHKIYPAGLHTKVTRGQSFADAIWTLGVNVYRTPSPPDADLMATGHFHVYSMTSRCVVNSEEPLN